MTTDARPGGLLPVPMAPSPPSVLLPTSAVGDGKLSISVADAQFSLRHDRELARALLRIPLPVFYFCCFVGMLFAHVPSETLFEQGSAVYETLVSTGDDTVTADSPVKFANIQSIGDVFDWLELSLAPSVFVTTDYNDDPLTQDKWGRVASFNKVLGAVNLQVTRRASHACDTQPFLQQLYPTCYDPDVTQTDNVLISFDTNATAAAAKFVTLRETGTWLDSSVAELLITIVTYNGELQGYAVTELTLEFQQGGSIVPSGSTTPALSDPYQKTDAAVLDFLVVFCFFVALGGQARKIRRHRQHGWVRLLTNVWTLIELASSALVVAFYGVWISIVMLMYNKTFRDNLETLVKTGQNWSSGASGAEANKLVLTAVTDSLQRVAKLTIALRLVATFAVFLLGLRVLKRFRFHPRLSLLTRTMGHALHQFVSFFVVFIVVFMTFAVSGTVLFGDRVAEFSSLSIATESCVNMLFGNFDTDTISDMYSPVGMIYYWVYMIIVSLVLLNMMLAIVLDAYAEVSQEANQARGNLAASRVLRNTMFKLALAMNEWRSSKLRIGKPAQKVHELDLFAGAVDGSGHKNAMSSASVRLGRQDVVFRGRVRPKVLESLSNAMLSGESGAKTQLRLTPQSLMNIFRQAELTEREAQDTIKYLLDGIMRQSEDEGGIHGKCCEQTDSLIDQVFAEGNGGKIDSAMESIRSPMTTMSGDEQPYWVKTAAESTDRQQSEILARMTALDQKLDALLTRMAAISTPTLPQQ